LKDAWDAEGAPVEMVVPEEDNKKGLWCDDDGENADDIETKFFWEPDEVNECGAACKSEFLILFIFSETFLFCDIASRYLIGFIKF
jgi:hypothetical protein